MKNMLIASFNTFRNGCLLALLTGTVLAQPTALAAETTKELLENEALNILARTVDRDSLYKSWTKMNCLSFLTDAETSMYFDFSIHEKHGGNCPGDPSTEPTIDRFRVMRATKIILWYDTVDGEYVTYDPHKITGRLK